MELPRLERHRVSKTEAPRGFDELTYISRYFDVVEINSSYYGAPRPSFRKEVD